MSLEERKQDVAQKPDKERAEWVRLAGEPADT